MSTSIVQLGISDFEEAIAHLNLAFGEADFASLVPALYQPTEEHMRRNLAVRHDGRIAAMVGLFPIDWIVGPEKLRLAGIGGVSVHPDFRGKGFMRLLMDATLALVAEGGFHAACLGGNRRRYGYWGFEKAGIEATFVVTHNSFEHALSRKDGQFAVGVPAERDLTDMHTLYGARPIRCERTPEQFQRHLRNWRREPLVAREQSGRVTGYWCVDPRDASCVECCCENPESLEALLDQRLMSAPQPVRVSMPLIQDSMFHRLDELSDDCTLIEAGNWRIYDWPAVLGALLKTKHGTTPLPPGSCVVRLKPLQDGPIKDMPDPTSFRLFVGDAVGCTTCDLAPDLDTDPSTLLRTFAGPIPQVPAPGADALSLWRPLPLMIPMQDRI